VNVRPATPADLETIVRFNAALARETEDVALDEKRLRPGVRAVFDDPRRGRYFLLEDDGRPIAQLLVTFEWSDWRNGDFWWIQSVYVERAHRRRGAYRALHEHVVSAARVAGACGVRLYVERANGAARAVYERLGLAAAPYEMLETDFVIRRERHG